MNHYRINEQLQLPYYPDIKAYPKHSREEHQTYGTILRKKHEGVWYCWIIKGYPIDHVHEMAYQAAIMGVIDPTLKRTDGTLIFEKDYIQIEEAERLSKIIFH